MTLTLEQAKGLLGSLVRIRTASETLIGKLQYVWETHEVGKTSVTIQMRNVSGFEGLTDTRDFDVNLVLGWRKLEDAA